ncbi:DUF7537 family lipoprotein [Halosimplex sp. J119]
MTATVRSAVLLAFVGTLVVTAGCQGVMTDREVETATSAGADATPEATDAASAETARADANGSATGTATETTGSTVGGDESAIWDSHLSALRAAGSATVNTTTVQTIRTGNRTVTRTQVRLGRVDFGSGRAYTRLDPLSGGVRERYRNGSGATFTQTGLGKFFGPERSDAINTTQILTVTRGNPDALERRGSGTVDGFDGTVYTADSYTGLWNDSTDVDPENVTAFNLTYVVDDAGYVKYLGVTVTVEIEDRQLVHSARRRFTEVGSTTVSEPDWLNEAKAVAARPDSDDIVTRTYNATGEDGRVEMDVTATHGELDGYATVGPEVSSNPMFRNEFLNRYRVGEIARYYFSLDTVESVTIRVHYDDDAVEDGNESTLRLATLNRTTQLIEPVDTTVDAEHDTASVTFTNEASLNQYQGETFLLLQWSQYVSGLQERDDRMDSGPNSLTSPGRETGGV